MDSKGFQAENIASHSRYVEHFYSSRETLLEVDPMRLTKRRNGKGLASVKTSSEMGSAQMLPSQTGWCAKLRLESLGSIDSHTEFY
jgi:hypothetical protein